MLCRTRRRRTTRRGAARRAARRGAARRARRAAWFRFRVRAALFPAATRFALLRFFAIVPLLRADFAAVVLRLRDVLATDAPRWLYRTMAVVPVRRAVAASRRRRRARARFVCATNFFALARRCCFAPRAVIALPCFALRFA